MRIIEPQKSQSLFACGQHLEENKPAEIEHNTLGRCHISFDFAGLGLAGELVRNFGKKHCCDWMRKYATNLWKDFRHILKNREGSLWKK